MNLLDKKLASRAASRFGTPQDIAEPISYHGEGEPALRTRAAPKRKRTASIDTSVYPESAEHLNRIVNTLRMQGNQKITKSELLETAIRLLGEQQRIA